MRIYYGWKNVRMIKNGEVGRDGKVRRLFRY